MLAYLPLGSRDYNKKNKNTSLRKAVKTSFNPLYSESLHKKWCSTQGCGAGVGARSPGAGHFSRSRSWSCFQNLAGAGAGAVFKI